MIHYIFSDQTLDHALNLHLLIDPEAIYDPS